MAFSLAGSICLITPTKFSNTVLTSVLTLVDRNTAPDASRLGLGTAGGTRSTYLTPNIVVALISAATLAGMLRIWSGKSSKVRLTGPAVFLTEATRPTSTPRILTLAPGSMTRPARSEVNVTRS